MNSFFKNLGLFQWRLWTILHVLARPLREFVIRWMYSVWPGCMGCLCVVAPLHEGGRTLHWVAELHWSTCDTQLWRMAPRSCKQTNGHTPGNGVDPAPELLQGSQLSLGPVYRGLDKNFCTDKILHGFTLDLHEPDRWYWTNFWTAISVQIWNLLFSGPKLALLAVQKFVRW